MSDDFFTKPTEDSIEITLLGTGGGYGESIVLHLGNSEWIIVDSCVNPNTNTPLSIDYLRKLGVDIKHDVKRVICTHWHNDHILGLSSTLEQCENAKFCMPQVNNTALFLKYVGLDCEKLKKGSISSLNEFQSCIDIVNARDAQIKRASSDTVVFSKDLKLNSGHKYQLQLSALSPSDSAVSNYDMELATLLNEFKISKVAVTEKKANEKSVALYLKFKNKSAILGADLEVNNNKDEGWLDVVNNSAVFDIKSIVYKVPHHGSSNGYRKEIYEHLIDDNAILKITPWNRNDKLPQPEMLSAYKSHSDNVYITSPISLSTKSKKRDKSTDKLVKLFSKKLVEVKFEEGLVRTRHHMVSDEVVMETYGSALKI